MTVTSLTYWSTRYHGLDLDLDFSILFCPIGSFFEINISEVLSHS